MCLSSFFSKIEKIYTTFSCVIVYEANAIICKAPDIKAIISCTNINTKWELVQSEKSVDHAAGLSRYTAKEPVKRLYSDFVAVAPKFS